MINVMTSHLQEEVDLEKFWRIETLGIENTENSKIDDKYMLDYKNTHISFRDGKYHAKLPWKDKHRGSDGQDVKVGDIVLVHDETPRIYWPLGRIEELTTGRDGHTRAVRVRTRRGILSRPVAKLYPLEIRS
jgi:hypothetical protein